VTTAADEVVSGLTRDTLLAQAVQASADAVFCQDTNGTVTTWNPAAERIFGWSAEQVLDRRAEDLFPARTRDGLLDAYRTALAGQRVERFDSWHQRSDGTLVPVNVSASPLWDSAGQVVAVATTIADITERIRLDRELKRVSSHLTQQNAALLRSNRDLEQFAYVASHDLSEPLRVMTSFVAQIERRYDSVLDERGRRYMGHIIEASARMRALIDDLLDYSRFLRAPQQTLKIDTEAIVARVLKTLAGPITDAHATVEVQPLPSVWSDASHLESLLSNLISNAIKFRSADGPVRVRVSGIEAEGWVTLAVDDNGIGIAPEYRERVFRMFQRLHVREAYAGTGIGMAIAQQIVELHHGRIWIEDSDLGGARFSCTLPAEPPNLVDHG
jgi:PAS domain S-box-containing protein